MRATYHGVGQFGPLRRGRLGQSPPVILFLARAVWYNDPVAMRRALFYLTIAAAVGYGGLLIWKTSFAVGGSDSSGYANEARMIVAGRLVQPIEALDRLELPDRFGQVFRPLAHEPGPRPRTMVPYYPPGYPLHFAAAAILGGWAYAPFFVSPFAALLLVVATYFLSRELGLSRLLAFAAAAILAGCAVLLFQAVQAMSDVVAALWATAAVLFALRSRKAAAWAAAAGASFGVAVLVRPTNAILGLPLLFALGWRASVFALFAASGVPFAAFQASWNSRLFGGPLRTGYEAQLGDFGWSNFSLRLAHYARTVAQMFSPLVPLGWLGVAGDRRVPLRDRALLLSWFAGYLLFYCFWGPYDAWWYTRYLLPAFPALVVGAVLVARDLLRHTPSAAAGPLRSPRPAIVLATALFLIVALTERRRILQWKPLGIAEGEKIYVMAMDLARAKLPQRSLVVSVQMSGSLRYYTDFQPVRWDWLWPPDFSVLRTNAEARGYRLFALLFPWEEKELALHAPGKWKKAGRVGDVILWELE